MLVFAEVLQCKIELGLVEMVVFRKVDVGLAKVMKKNGSIDQLFMKFSFRTRSTINSEYSWFLNQVKPTQIITNKKLLL